MNSPIYPDSGDAQDDTSGAVLTAAAQRSELNTALTTLHGHVTALHRLIYPLTPPQRAAAQSRMIQVAELVRVINTLLAAEVNHG